MTLLIGKVPTMNEEKRINPGIPEHEPTEITRRLVMGWYAAGIPQKRICDHLDIDEKTLRKHYRVELDYTLDGMISKLSCNLYQDALNGDKSDREFWLKTRGRFSYAKAAEEDAKEKAQISLMEKLIDKL